MEVVTLRLFSNFQLEGWRGRRISRVERRYGECMEGEGISRWSKAQCRGWQRLEIEAEILRWTRQASKL